MLTLCYCCLHRSEGAGMVAWGDLSCLGDVHHYCETIFVQSTRSATSHARFQSPCKETVDLLRDKQGALSRCMMCMIIGLPETVRHVVVQKPPKAHTLTQLLSKSFAVPGSTLDRAKRPAGTATKPTGQSA
jgi:hypothetical protein